MAKECESKVGVRNNKIEYTTRICKENGYLDVDLKTRSHQKRQAEEFQIKGWVKDQFGSKKKTSVKQLLFKRIEVLKIQDALHRYIKCLKKDFLNCKLPNTFSNKDSLKNDDSIVTMTEQDGRYTIDSVETPAAQYGGLSRRRRNVLFSQPQKQKSNVTIIIRKDNASSRTRPSWCPKGWICHKAPKITANRLQDNIKNRLCPKGWICHGFANATDRPPTIPSLCPKGWICHGFATASAKLAFYASNTTPQPTTTKTRCPIGFKCQGYTKATVKFGGVFRPANVIKLHFLGDIKRNKRSLQWFDLKSVEIPHSIHVTFKALSALSNSKYL